MKKLVTFFIGLILMLCACGMLVLTSAIYDSGENFVIRPYFFTNNDLNNLASTRPNTPNALNEITDTKMRVILIKKFVTEYFYATPDSENIAQRIHSGVLNFIATPAVFNQWKDGEAVVITNLAEKNAMRSVLINDEILKTDNSDDAYWVVSYELQTWMHPNKLSEAPMIKRGKMYLRIAYKAGLREPEDMNNMSLQNFLDKYDPMGAFKFGVTYVEYHTEQ